MCQLDWATECPDVSSDFILGMSVKMLLNDINIWICRLSIAFPNEGGPIQSVEGLNRTKRPTIPYAGENTWLQSWDISLSWLWTQLKIQFFLGLEHADFQTSTHTFSPPGTEALVLRLKVHIGSPRFLTFLSQVLGFLSLHNHVSQSFIYT